jgi:AFG3 family protein
MQFVKCMTDMSCFFEIRAFFLGFLIYMMRRSAEVMGARGRKGGGLFGGVMESTAKLINSNDIGVRFK